MNRLRVANANVIDGLGNFTERQAIEIDLGGGRFKSLGTGTTTSGTDGHVIELSSSETVIPGLIDLHVHPPMNWSGSKSRPSLARPNPVSSDSPGSEWYGAFLDTVDSLDSILKTGFTTVRMCGSPPFLDLALREGIKRGSIAGPRLFVSGMGLCAKGGHLAKYGVGAECNGVSDFVRNTRIQIRRGADFVKIAADYVRHPGVSVSRKEMNSVSQVAHNSGKKVAVHAQRPQAIEDACMANVDTIEHGIFLCEQGERLTKLMKEREIIYVPTLAATASLHPATSLITTDMIRDLRLLRGTHFDSFRRALRTGVQIGFGTDSGFGSVRPGTGYDEFQLMSKNGMSPMECIVSATNTASRALGASGSLGTIETGKLADFVVVSGNPLKSLSALSRVKMVFKRGRLVHSQDSEKFRIS